MSGNTVTREISSLYTTILRIIAKKPSIYLNDKSIIILNNITYNKTDIVQVLIDSITEAGRLTDDSFPTSLFKSDRTSICIRNSKLSGKYIRSIMNNCKNLITIDLSGSFQVDDNTILYILDNNKLLIDLNIRNCRKITNYLLNQLVKIRHKLRLLDIGGNFNIDEDSLYQFVSNYEHISTIEEFNISGLNVYDRTVQQITRNCTNLFDLSIAYADISEDSLRKLIQSTGSKLIKLNISWLSTTSDVIHKQPSAECICDVLIKNCPKLIELDISGLKTISINNLQYLLESMNQQVITQEIERNQPLKLLYARFIQSTKSLLEVQLVPFYPNIKFIL